LIKATIKAEEEMRHIHEYQVNKFLRSKHLPNNYINYDNVLVYTKAKYWSLQDIVSIKDRKSLNKFIKNWVITKGDVKPNYVKRVLGIIKYYNNKTQNLASRNARLQRKKNLKLNMA